MTKNILVTGKPGCGKSTLVHKLRERLKGRNISGFITPEIKRGGKRYGFKIIDLLSNQEEIMASVDVQSQNRVSKYYVAVEAIDRIMNKLEKSFEEAEVFIIDEIGKMELYSERFKKVIKKFLDSSKPVVATITLARDPFIDEIKRRADCKMFYLEKNNGESTLNKIEAVLNRFL